MYIQESKRGIGIVAKVGKLTPEAIELLRGKVDFYMLRGILPVARRWPKKPKPPYTALQAEGMAVFSMAASSMQRLSPNILEVWKISGFGKRSQWPDSYKAIAMKYWKLTRTFPLIALDYNVIDTGDFIRVEWDVLKLYIDPLLPEETYKISTEVIAKSDIEKAIKPIYFTLLDDSGNRQLSPFIEYEVVA